jgi:TonB-dependent receptor
MPYPLIQHRLISLAVASACAAMAMPAHAQTTPPTTNQVPAETPVQMPAPVKAPAQPKIETQSVTVTGFRGAAEDALNIKRSADGFVDAISADGLGRFPDLNVGEALTRIPGIQLDRTEGDRTARVALRGLPGGYTVVTLNGMMMADPSVSANGSPLGTFSLDVFNRIVVNKSPSAADASGGIAGNIDLQFNGALARKEGGTAKLSSEYNSLGKTFSPSTTIGYNKRLTPDFAVFGTLSYKKENFRRDSLTYTYSQLLDQRASPYPRPTSNTTTQNLGYNVITQPDATNPRGLANPFPLLQYYAAPGTTNGTLDEVAFGTTQSGGSILSVPARSAVVTPGNVVGTGTTSKRGVQFVSRFEQNGRYSKGENTSLSTGFEYRLNKSWKLDTTLLSADKNLKDAGSEQLSYNLATDGVRIVPDMNSLYTTDQGFTYLDKFAYYNPQLATTNTAIDNRRQLVRSLTTNLVFSRGAWRVTSSANLSTGRGTESTLGSQLQVSPANQGTLASPEPRNKLSGSFSGGYGSLSDAYWKLDTPNVFTAPSRNLLVNQQGFTLSPTSTNYLPAVIATKDSEQVSEQPTLVSALPGSALIPGTDTGAANLRLTGRYVERTNKVSGFAQHFERSLDDLPIASVKFGYAYERNQYRQLSQQAGIYGARLDGIANPALTSGTSKVSSDYFGGRFAGYNANWQQTNYQHILDNVLPTEDSLVPGTRPAGLSYYSPATTTSPAGFSVSRIPLGLVVNPYNTNGLLNSFTSDYNLASMYVMANIDTKAFSIPVRGNIGIRHEKYSRNLELTSPLLRTVPTTTASSAANTRNNIGSTSLSNSYSFNLPSLMLAASLRKNLIVRYGIYDTYVRPARNEINPVSIVSKAETTTATTYNINGFGGRTIKPYTATSQDVAIEWYNRKGSVVGIGIYQKKIKGQIYDISLTTDPDLICPADGKIDGVDYGIGALKYVPTATASQRCQTEALDTTNVTTTNLLGVPAFVNVTNAKRNNPNTITARGIDLKVQQNLSFLPAPWSNFGGEVNYSQNTYNSTLPTGAKLILPNVAKQNYNLIGYYDQGPFGIRIIYNKRGKVLVSGGAAGKPWNDVYTKPRGQIDMSTSWKFKGDLIVALDISNLTDVLVERYRYDERVSTQKDYDGRTATLTVRAPF